MKTFSINVDTIVRIVNQQTPTYNQGDVSTAILDINITQNNVPYDLTGSSVSVFFQKADDTIVYQDITNGVSILNAVGGQIEVCLNTQTLAYPGSVIGALAITSGSSTIETRRFTFDVRPSLTSDNALKSNNELSPLIGTASLTTTAKDIKGAINELNADLTTANTNVATNTANITSHAAQIALKANQSDLNTTNANVAANASQITSNTASLAHNANHTKGRVNIYEYQNLVVGSDWTNAIQTALNNMASGGTLFFPEGQYNHTGFTIPAKYISILGSGRYSSILKNTSTNNAITIAPLSERGSIKEIGILGNGSTLYGTDATSGHGIVFSDNSISWNFENVTVRGHGGDAFHGGELGHVNNINILNSEIEMNKGNGVYFFVKASVSALNAVNVRGCNVANNGASGFALWGNNMSIQENTVQGNRLYGFNISSDLMLGTGWNNCDMIIIKRNYSEQNLFGLLNIKVDKITSPITYKYIKTLIFEENFGNEDNCDASVTSICNIVKGSNVAGLYDQPIRCFIFRRNALYSTNSSMNILNCNNLLDGNSIIEMNYDDENKFLNLGYAQYNIKKKTKVLNNYFNVKGVAVADITTGKTANIPNNTTIYYPIDIQNFSGVYDIGIPCDTDVTFPHLSCKFYGRPKGSKAAYTLLQTRDCYNMVNGVLKPDLIWTYTPISGYEDIYLQITVSTGGTGTYLYIYNPYIVFD